MEFALGHFLTFSNRAGGSLYRFQNLFIGETVDGFSFLPFGFSGLTTSRQGDNIDAALTFPNNSLSRPWAQQAITEFWIGTVDIYSLNPSNFNDRSKLYSYVGRVSSGGWDETSLNMRLNTVIDAVQTIAPNRVLHRRLVGSLPATSSFGL